MLGHSSVTNPAPFCGRTGALCHDCKRTVVNNSLRSGWPVQHKRPCRRATSKVRRRLGHAALPCCAAAQSLYEVLGVSQDASARDIKKAFKQKALKLHPDINKAANASEQFQECKMAYQTLIDSAARDKYNRELKDGRPAGFSWDNLWSQGRQQGQQAQQQPGAQKPAKQPEEPFYGFSDFFRDVGADWEAQRRKRAAKGTPTGSLWQELAGLGEDFVEFLENELARSSDPELRRQAQESAAQSGSTASQTSTSRGSRGSSASTSGWSDPTADQAQTRAAQIQRDNEERKKRTNDEVEDMLADMKRKLGLKEKT